MSRLKTFFYLNLPSPLYKLESFTDDCEVYVKREDLIHSEFGGNKFRKLKYNVAHFLKNDFSHLITFGGPFSNHIAATAAYCSKLNIPSVGLIRGTYVDPNNPTLIKAKALGMEMHHIPKLDYKEKETSAFIKNIISKYPDPYIIPEGGNNKLAYEGVHEAALELVNQLEEINYVMIAGGTGATSIGMIQALPKSVELIIINALKNQELEKIIADQCQVNSNWQVLHDYHLGGFAKTTSQQQDLSNILYEKNALVLDPVYNSKMFYALNDLLSKSFFKKGSNIVCLHTGGLQGIDAWNYRQKSKWIKF